MWQFEVWCGGGYWWRYGEGIGIAVLRGCRFHSFYVTILGQAVHASVPP